MEKEKEKSEYKFRIIKRKTLDWDVYEVQLFRKFLWREWRTDVKTFDYEDSAEKFIECFQAYRHPEIVKEYNIKL
jgi:hypothetical protein